MNIEHRLARILEIQDIWKEHFSRPQLKWEICDNEDEQAWIESGRYHLNNTTTSRWNFYHLESGVDFRDDHYIISARMRLHSAESGYAFGLVFGFDRYPRRLNRFVLNSKMNFTIIADFNREDSSPFERKSALLDRKKILQEQDDVEMVIMKISRTIYFFINDLKHPVFAVDKDFFAFTGGRLGFYTEPGIHISAESITVKRLITESLNEINAGDLLKA